MLRSLLIACLLLFAFYQGEGQNIRFQNKVRGGFAITGNGLLANTTTSFLNTAGGTLSSSSADLVLPPNSTIIKAYLYVEGYSTIKLYGLQFKVPGGNYVSYNALSPGFLGNPGNDYQQFMLDVTNVVPANGYVSTVVPGGDPGGSGRYAVADAGPTGANYGYGWSLVVVYTNPNAKYRHITIADNNAAFGLFLPPVTVTVNNVAVPATGPVNAVVGITGSYGDVGLPDGATFGLATGTGTALRDPYTGVLDDILNSSIAFAANNNVSADGGPAISGNFTGRNPYVYTSPNNANITNWSSYFYDADILNASGILPNSATPISVKFTQTSGGQDALGSGTYAIAVDIAAAVLTKSIAPASIVSGGIATYTFTIANNQAGAVSQSNIGFTDNLPPGLKIATPAAATISGGTGGVVTAVAGGNTVSLSGLSLNAGQTATMTVAVTNVPGQYNPSCAAHPAAFTNGFFNIVNTTPNLANGVSNQCLVVTQDIPPPVTDTVTYCQNATAAPLTATGSNLLWYTVPAGGAGSAAAPVPSTATAGTTTYYVSQTVAGAESPRAALPVIVNTTVTNAISAHICSGNTYTFGGQNLGTAGAYSHTFAAATGCDSIVTLNLTVNNAVQVNQSAAICQGQGYTFNGTTYTTSGNYNYTAASVTGCDSTTTLHLTVNPVKTHAIAAGICSGNSYTFGGQELTATGIYTHSYTTPDGCDSVVTLNLLAKDRIRVNVPVAICYGESYTFHGTTYTASGNYNYTATAASGCDSVTTLQLMVKEPVALPAVTASVAYCEKDIAAALAADGNNLTWYTTAAGGVGTAAPPVPATAVTGTTIYYVSQTIAGCESARAAIEVKVHPNPEVRASREVEAGMVYLRADAKGTGLSYHWDLPQGLSCTDCPRPEANPGQSTVYTVTVTDENGCKASDTVGVYLQCGKVFFPNSFTPNGDGNNDRFYPMGLSLKIVKSFRVFNRWGELVYSRSNIPANDPAYGWDGTYQGAILGPGTFIFSMEGTCESGENIFRKGDINLIR